MKNIFILSTMMICSQIGFTQTSYNPVQESHSPWIGPNKEGPYFFGSFTTCDTDSTLTEKTICGDEKLTFLDWMMNLLWRSPSLKARNALTNEIGNCGRNKICLQSIYNRILASYYTSEDFQRDVAKDTLIKTAHSFTKNHDHLVEIYQLRTQLASQSMKFNGSYVAIIYKCTPNLKNNCKYDTFGFGSLTNNIVPRLPDAAN